MNKNKVLIGIAAILILASMAYALEIKSGTSEDLTIFLRNSTDGIPIAGATCTLDIWNPSDAKILDDGAMTELGEGFYYFSTYTNWTTLGDYRVMARCIVGSDNYYAATLFEIVETTVTEWFESINDSIAATYNYLQNTLYPAVDTLESSMTDVLANQSNIYTKLAEIQDNVTTNYNEIIDTQTQLGEVNDSIQTELDDHKQRLIELNSTVTEILENITLTINPKLDQLQTDVTIINTNTDSLEAGQQEILGNLTELDNSIQEINTSVSAITGYVDEIEEMLDCDTTADTPICSKLDQIQTDVDTLETYTDSLEAGQTTIQNYVDTLETGQTTIQSDLSAIIAELNCSTIGDSDICTRLQTINDYVDTLEAGQTTIQNYVDTLEQGQLDLLNNVSLIQGYTDTLETAITNLDADIQAWEVNATERFDTIDTTLTGIVSTTDSLYTLLECNGSDPETWTADSLCSRLSNIETIVTDVNLTANEIKAYLEGTITDFLTDINNTVTNIYDYLQNTIYPAVDTLEIQVQNILDNQTTTWNKLVEIQDNVTTNYNEIINAQSLVIDMNLSVMVEFQENKDRLLAMNSTLIAIYDNITQTLNPKLDQLQTDVTTINTNTDSLEAGQQQILANLSDIQTDLDSIDLTLSVIEGYVDSVEESLNCDGTDDTPVCAKLDQINTTVNIINTNTDTLEAGQTTIQSYVDTLESGQTTIQSDLAEIIAELNCSTSNADDICFRLALIEGYTDSLESGQTTIQDYVDTLEAGQQDIFNNLTLLQSYTDTLESAVANLDSDLQNWELNATARLDSIDSTLSGIVSTTDSLYTLMECNGSDPETWAADSLCTRLSNIETIVTNVNLTANEIKAYLEGTITDFLSAINQTTTDIWNLLLSLNTTIHAIQTDTQDILTKWDTYNMSQILIKLDSMDTKLDNIEGSNNSEILLAITSIESILNSTRAELGFEGQSLTAYEYFVQLESELIEINTTIINKIEFEANQTATEIMDAIQGNTTLLLSGINDNSDDLAVIIANWGNVTAEDIISDITDNRNTLIDIENWLNAFNITEETRYNDSQSILNSLLAWFGFINESEEDRHDLVLEKLDNLTLEVDNTEELTNQLIALLGYNGTGTDLRTEILTLISQNDNITLLAQELNLTTHSIEDTVIDINETVTDINNTVTLMYDYLQNTVFPAVDSLETQVQNVIDNQSTAWNKLLEIQTDIATNYNEITDTQLMLVDMNASLQFEIADNKQKLIAMNLTLVEVLDNITQTINPKLDLMQSDIDTIETYTDSIETSQQWILDNLSVVQDYTDSLESAVANLDSDLQSWETTATARFDTIDSSIAGISTNVDALYLILECNGSSNETWEPSTLCSRLDYISSIVDEVNLTSTQIQSYLEGEVTALLEEINQTTHSVYDYLQNTIYPAVDSLETEVQNILDNQSTAWSKLLEIQTDIATNYNEILESQTLIIDMNASLQLEIDDNKQRLIAIDSIVDDILSNITQIIDPKLDQIQTDIDLIETYTDSIEIGQQDILNNISLVQDYTDSLEGAVANLDADLQSWEINATARFDTIDSSIIGITTTVNTLYLMLECNGTNPITWEVQGLCDTLSKIKLVADEANATIHDTKDYLEGTITDFLTDINSTLYNTYDILVGINSTVGSVQNDVQSILSKWGTYDAEQLFNKSVDIETKIDAVQAWLDNFNATEEARYQDVLTAVNDVETLAENIRLEIGLNGTGFTAYELLVQLDSKLIEINSTIINKIEFEANLTRTEVMDAIQSNTTLLLNGINDNSNDLAVILSNWGNATADDILTSITDNRNTLITLQAWMDAFNTTEEQRHDDSQSLLNDVLAWLGYINQSEEDRHIETLEKIDETLLEINSTKDLINSLIADIGYDGTNLTLYDEILRIIEMNNNITNIVTEINLTVNEIKDIVIAMNQTLGWIQQNTQDILAKWSTYNVSHIINQLDAIDSQLNTLEEDSINQTAEIIASIATLESIVNSTRAELGFEGQSITAYEYFVQMDTELTEINSTLFAKIAAESAQTRAELSAAIESNVTAIINEIDANENKIDSILSNWGGISLDDILGNITATRNDVIALDSWLKVYNETMLNETAEIYDLINNAVLFELNLTKSMTNDLITQIGYDSTNMTLIEHLTQVNSSLYSHFDDVLIQLDWILDVTSEINTTNYQLVAEMSVIDSTVTALFNIINDMDHDYSLILNNTEILINKSDIIINKFGNYTLDDIIDQLGGDYNVSELLEKWGSFDAQDLWNKLVLIEYKIEHLDDLNITIDNSEVLQTLNALRDEIGFNGTGITAYEYLMQLETELLDINTTILNKIEIDANRTIAELTAVIESNVSLLLNEINLNSNDLATILTNWGNVSAQEIIDAVSDTRIDLLDLKNWMIAFNTTEELRYNDSMTVFNSIIEWLGLFNETESARHDLTQQMIDQVFAEINGTKDIINQILVQVDYSTANSTLYEDIQELLAIVANITGSAGNVVEIDYIILYNGSNLVAMPKQPSNISIEFVMSNITGKYERVDHYDSQTGVWLIYNPNAPFGNTLQTMESGNSYWIYATEPVTLYIN